MYLCLEAKSTEEPVALVNEAPKEETQKGNYCSALVNGVKGNLFIAYRCYEWSCQIPSFLLNPFDYLFSYVN